MLAVTTVSKGRPWSGLRSLSRYSSALIAISPRTAYSTLRTCGLSESGVRLAIFTAVDVRRTKGRVRRPVAQGVLRVRLNSNLARMARIRFMQRKTSRVTASARYLAPTPPERTIDIDPSFDFTPCMDK